MFKKSIGIPIIMFLFLAIKQLIFDSEILWIDNMLFSVFLFLFHAFWEWANIQYDWSKHKTGK